jgi:hypothetical protein
MSLFTVLRSNSCRYVVIVLGKGCVCAGEEPKDKKKSKVMFLLEKVKVSFALDRRIGIAAV